MPTDTTRHRLAAVTRHRHILELLRMQVECLAPGMPVWIVRLATLLRLKAAAGRAQDLADIAELRQLHGDGADD